MSKRYGASEGARAALWIKVEQGRRKRWHVRGVPQTCILWPLRIWVMTRRGFSAGNGFLRKTADGQGTDPKMDWIGRLSDRTSEAGEEL